MKLKLVQLIELLENGTFALETLPDACALVYYLDSNYGRDANRVYERIVACDKGGHFAMVWGLYMKCKLSKIQKEALLYHYRYAKLGRELKTYVPMKRPQKCMSCVTPKRKSKKLPKGMALDLQKPSHLVSIINGNVTIVKRRYLNASVYFEDK